tara:strand:- start:62 stop:1102 length:1041 start_codon:yes stop_codon:yes gene_type:complete
MNTIDKVLLEWSLKTDKGYPDINSKEDMDLFESMFGIRLNTDSDILKEDQEDDVYTVDDLINIITQRKDDLSPDFLKKLYYGIKNKGLKLGTYLLKTIEEKELADSKEELFDLIKSEAGLELKLSEVLKDPKKQLKISDLGDSGDLVSAAQSKTGLPKTFLEKLIVAGRASAGGKGVGNGEAFLALLGYKGRKLDVGDVSINGKSIELKGYQGRLGDRSGLQDLYSKLDNISNVPSDTTLHTYVPKILKTNPELNSEVLELLNTEFNKKFDDITSPDKFKKELLKWYASSYLAEEVAKGLNYIMIVIGSKYRLYTPSQFISAVEDGDVTFKGNFSKASKHPQLRSF